MFRDLARDLRLAIRSLTAAPVFSAGVIASLTLGIVANTAAFSFVNAAVFRPFPGVGDQHELVRVGVARRMERSADISSTYEEYERLRAALPGVLDLAAHHSAEVALTFGGESSAVPGALVSANYFDVLGVRPAAGRFFMPDESRTAVPVAVIAHATWRRLFNEDPAAVGQTVMVNGVSMTVVGVAPPRFSGIDKGRYDLAVWLPFGMSHVVLRDAARRPVTITSAGYLPLTHVGRRRPDATLDQIEAQAAAAGLQIDALRPPDRKDTTASATGVWMNDPARMAPAIVGFMAVPLLVLVIACVNAANLLFARSSRQSRDWQVRLALGASRWRIVRQVLAESVLLAAVSCAAGLVVTSWVLDLVEGSVPVPVPLDARVQLFTIAAAAATAIAFGLGPAMHVASRGAVDPRRLSTAGGGTARSRVRFALIAAQAALSLGLLATGAQFVNTVRAGSGRSVVPDSERLLLAAFNLEPFNMPRAASDDFYARLLDRTASIPGVVSAGVTSAGPLAGTLESIRFWLPDESAGAGRRSVSAFVSGEYFEAVRAPLVEGRTFTSADRAGAAPAAIVSQAFAKRYFGGHALNRSLRVAFGAGGTYASGIDLTVVGVVGPVPGERGDGLPMLYIPAPLADAPARWLYVRFDDSGRFTLGALQGAVREIDYRVPIRQAATLQERRARTDDEPALIANGVAALGLFALILAAGGLYGVVSYIVALRRREIGVRLALGATRRSVVRLVVRQGLVPAAVGAIAGAGGAAAIGAIVRSRLYGAAPVDPLAFGGAAALLIATMVVASVIPARHAANVDPMVVLRED